MNPADAPAIGKVSGQVLDATTKEAIPYAPIAIFNVRDSSIAGGGMTDEKGRFSIENVKMGRLRARISFIGYEKQETEVFMINQRQLEVSLGTINLGQALAATKAVELVVERPVMTLEVDRKVFNVEKMIVAEGGSANDVLRQIPSVNVDIDGNLTLRGSGGVNVLIDGKPSGLSGGNRQALLENLPAGSIERIEVITNPSAKFDPDGSTGIINIVLKKNRQDGTNGMVQLGVGTRNKYNANVSLNRKTGKWNLGSNYSYRYNDRWMKGYSFRSNTTVDSTFFIEQTMGGLRHNQNHQLRLSADYDINKAHRLSASATGNLSTGNGNQDIYYKFLDEGRQQRALSLRTGDNTSDNTSMDYRLGYIWTLGPRNHEFSSSVSYSNNFNEDRESLLQRDLANPEAVTFRPNYDQRTRQRTDFNIVVAQADFMKPVGTNGKFETGAKSILRNIGTSFLSESRDRPDLAYTFNPNISNDLLFHEQVHAVYGMYGSSLGRLKYNAGLRLESQYIVINQPKAPAPFDRTIYNYFPSAQMAYALNDENDVQLTYSRRIDRAGPMQLNPFPDYSDPFNLRRGNPALLPEFINNLELSHSLRKGPLTTISTVYMRYTSNIIQRIRTVQPNGVSVTTFENLNKSVSYGGEGTIRLEPSRKFNIMVSGNLFNTTISGNTLAGDLRNNNWGWNTRTMANFKPMPRTDVQLSYNYNARFVTAQGSVGPFTSADIAVRRELWGGKGALSLSLQDIFNTMQMQMQQSGIGFTSTGYRKRESRVLTLNFTWKFGSTSMERTPRKGGRRGDSEGSGGDSGGGGMMDGDL